jgi:hypothetical protein
MSNLVLKQVTPLGFKLWEILIMKQWEEFKMCLREKVLHDILQRRLSDKMVSFQKGNFSVID